MTLHAAPAVTNWSCDVCLLVFTAAGTPTVCPNQNAHAVIKAVAVQAPVITTP